MLEPDLTLNKAVSIAVQMETALKNLEILSDTSQVQAIQSHRNVKQQDRKTSPSSSSVHPVANARQWCSCYHCRSNSHLANKPSCPAIRAVCNSCGKIGHFAKVCRSSQKQVREIVIPELTVLYINVSILPESIYRKHFSSCTLNPAKVILVSYSRETIPVLVCFSTDVFHDGSSAVGTFSNIRLTFAGNGSAKSTSLPY